jgi:hypothetical protein
MIKDIYVYLQEEFLFRPLKKTACEALGYTYVPGLLAVYTESCFVLYNVETNNLTVESSNGEAVTSKLTGKLLLKLASKINYKKY